MSTATLFTAALAAALTGTASMASAQTSSDRLPATQTAPVLAGTGETYVSPYEGRPAPLGGLDNPAPTPLGEVFYQPSELSPAGVSDEQLARTSRQASPLAGMHDRLYIGEQAGALWIRGRTYKARIADAGFTYIPFLGSDAPQNYPTSFRLATATIGGRPLRLTDRAEIRQAGERFVLDRGPVEVVYDVALDSVEQSFVLDVAGASGDLVLTLDVDSALQAGPDGAGFRFAGPDGGMNYSAAIVFDAAGRVADVPAHLSGGTLQLTVPASFLASAEGQIVVDPIFSTFSVDTVSGDQRNADVAYDITTDTFTYVYEDSFSVGDMDIYRTTVDIFGVFESGNYIDSSSDTWRDPSIANLNSTNSHLIVASRINGTSGFSEIMGRVVDVVANTTGPELLIGNANANWENFRPDVGGNATTSGGSWFVVWERRFLSTHVLARGATVSAAGSVGSFVAFTPNAPGFLQQEVVISKSTGNPSTTNVWSIALRQQELGTDTDTIQGVQLNASGAIINPIASLYTDTSNSRLREIDISDAIDVDGQAFPTYLVVFDDYSSIDADAELIMCRNNQAVRFSTIKLNEREHAITSRDQADVQLATTREDFVVSYLENDPAGSGFNVYVTTLDLTEGVDLAISERRTFVGNTVALAGGPPAMASRFSGGNLLSRYTGVAVPVFDSGGGDFDMHGLVHFASNGFAQAFQYCDGNPNSTGDRGFITLYGDRSTTGLKTLTASALPLNSVGFFINGDGFSNIANPGGSLGVLCVGGSIGRYSASAASSGSTGTISMPIDPTMLQTPNGPVPAMVGQFWQFQLWHRDSVGGTAVSNFTNACTLAFN